MSDPGSLPRPYPEWRQGLPRAEDAAHTFGRYLMTYCRDEALKLAVRKASDGDDTAAVAEQAVDLALHNVLDLLEGYWATDAGPDNRVRFRLSVEVLGGDAKPVETLDIAPGLDLPIAYWLWRDGEFRGL